MKFFTSLFKGNKAFTLVEVLVSVLLLSGLISIIVQLSYGNTRRMQKANKLEKIASLLELKMLELEEEFEALKKFENSRFSEQAQGEFDEEKNYFWSYETQAMKLPKSEILLSLIKLPDNELNRKMTNTITEVLSQTVIELKLTVYYEGKRGKQTKYSLVSYFVNYKEAPGQVFRLIGDLSSQGTAL